MKLVLGISGASGAPYAKRLLELCRAGALVDGLEIEVVLSRTAEQVWHHECGGNPRDLDFPVYEGRAYSAAFASGSARYQGMLVLPASMSCIGRIAGGISDDLLTRAADVALKERRPLVVVPRETPYSVVHLRNMLRLSEAGGIVLPASPAFYGLPQTLEQAMDTVIGRALDHLGIEQNLQARWGRDVRLAAPVGTGSTAAQKE